MKTPCGCPDRSAAWPILRVHALGWLLVALGSPAFVLLGAMKAVEFAFHVAIAPFGLLLGLTPAKLVANDPGTIWRAVRLVMTGCSGVERFHRPPVQYRSTRTDP